MTSSRRAFLAGTIAVLSAGCIGPSLNQDPPETPADTDEEEPTFDQAALEDLTETVREAIDLIDRAAGAFADWEDDPAAADIERFVAIRTDATDQWDRYGTEVLAHEEALRENDWPDWNGDPEALADLLEDHDALLADVEEGGLAIEESGGDPELISAVAEAAIDRVIEEGPGIVGETEAALPD